MRQFTLFFALISSLCAAAQVNDQPYEVFQISQGFEVIKSTCLSPDGTELAISTFQGKLKFIDANSFEEKRAFTLAGFNTGGRIEYSKNGKYIVFKKIRPNDANINKDNTQKVIILDVNTGKVLVSHDDVFDLALAPNSKTYAVMDKSQLTVRSFPEGKELSRISDPRLSSSIAYGPESDMLYASRGFDKKDLKKDPRFKKNRKGRKAYSKYQQTIVGYSIDDLAQSFISEENMDEIYDLRLSQKQDRLLIYAKQDEKVNAVLSTNFILQMELENGHLMREQFNSKLADPDYKENRKRNIIGVSTNEDMDRSQSVMLYDMGSNEIIARFDVDARFLEGLKLKTNLDGSASFDFSADGNYLYTCIGNNLYQWEIK